MKNEPAAWFYERPGETGKFMCGDAEAMKGIEKDGWVTTPLYTHPVKELTDDEILEQSVFCFGNQSEDFDDSYWIKFARAILRKAQEK